MSSNNSDILRIGFLPSDFNPMVLILGEAPALRRLTGALRRFARDHTDTLLHQLPSVHTSSPVVLTARAGLIGMSAERDRLIWRLTPDLAESFADAVEDLASPSRRAGSEVLECQDPDPLPVKVSRGEYTDEFLLPQT